MLQIFPIKLQHWQNNRDLPSIYKVFNIEDDLLWYNISISNFDPYSEYNIWILDKDYEWLFDYSDFNCVKTSCN